MSRAKTNQYDLAEHADMVKGGRRGLKEMNGEAYAPNRSGDLLNVRRVVLVELNVVTTAFLYSPWHATEQVQEGESGCE